MLLRRVLRDSGRQLQAQGYGSVAAFPTTLAPTATTTAITVQTSTATGAAVRLVFTVEPPTTVNAGAGFSVTVTAEDASGNVVTGNAVAKFSSWPSRITREGARSFGAGVRTISVTTSGGVATFTTNLSLSRPGLDYVLQATQGTLTVTYSLGIDVTASGATQLVVTSQPTGSVPTGGGFGLTVSAEDASGNVDSNYSGNVTVTPLPANNPGGAGHHPERHPNGQGGQRRGQRSQACHSNNDGVGYSPHRDRYRQRDQWRHVSSTTSAAASASRKPRPRRSRDRGRPSRAAVVAPGGTGFGFTVLVEDAGG